MKGIESEQTGRAGLWCQGLAGLTLAALVVIGAGGMIYRTLAPEGWLAQLFGRNPADGMAVLLSLIVSGIFAWLACGWINPQRRNQLSGLLVFIFAAAGLLQVVEFLLKSAA